MKNKEGRIATFEMIVIRVPLTNISLHCTIAVKTAPSMNSLFRTNRLEDPESN